ncbi:uncharacterized protein LOC133180631 [Saccostrea echinata]|uniref:uncharacterized protein LOC133180631 n=1 Tax=Saccostrea echinata TaxID=191078 RepID=UPI002A836C2F|nr:uncharacterized protein LOC133180631 [Saccostrea echinata]
MAENRVEESSGTAQHYIVCAICGESSNLYCNDCQQSICEQHRDVHLQEEKNSHHEVVLYTNRRTPLPAEKCSIHPTRDLEIYCDFCKNPICSKCSTSNHRNHQTSDLEIVYNEKLQQCKDRLTKIREEKLNSQTERTEKDEEIFTLMRSAMMQRAQEMKEVVDAVLSDKVGELGEMKESYLKETEKGRLTTEASIEALKNEMESASMKPSSLLTFHQRLSSQALEIVQESITDHPTLPTFIKGSENKREIEQQFGEINWPVKDLNFSRHEEAMNFSQSLLTMSKEREEDRGMTKSLRKIKVVHSIKLDLKIKRKINICTPAYHLSFLSSGKFWASNSWGNLILFDMEGNVLKKISTNVVDVIGYHSVTVEGHLLFTTAKSKAICQVNCEMNTTRIISTEEWEPGAIYSSHINGDILVGMTKNKEFKVTRYSREGKKLQVTKNDDEGNNLYKSIAYITENINGDICTSDYTAHRVVVVTSSGQYRFSYSGHRSQSGFRPYGICTDFLGHILVCNGYCPLFGRNCSSVHQLDMDGQFLSLLLTSDQCPYKPRALCFDEKHTLIVGSEDSSTVTVYKYLQKTENYT